jgi:AcrR family transcriptional regulator
MSLESVASEAGTTVPTLRRRHRDKASLAAAVVDSLRVTPLASHDASPRAQALAVLENFWSNLQRPHSLALLGTLLAEEQRSPELLERFRTRLVGPRRAMLADALRGGVKSGELPPTLDAQVAASMLIGSFYARYISHGRIPRNWPGRVLALLWPQP